MVWVESVCGSTKLEIKLPLYHTVNDLKQEISQITGVDENIQELSFNGLNLVGDRALQMYNISPSSKIKLSYDLDGAGNRLCIVCCCIKVRGGGCGCCPVDRWGTICEEWSDEEKKEGEGGWKLLCNVQ